MKRANLSRIGAFASVACILLASSALGAPPASLRMSSGALFLLGDGTLSASTGPSASSCASLQDGGPAEVSESFQTQLTNGTYHLDNESILLSLAFNADRQAGSGFRIDATLTAGNDSATTTKTYAAGASVDSPAVLAFPAHAPVNATGPLLLELTLAKTGPAGPLAVGHNVAVQCGHVQTKLESFHFVLGGVGDVDEDQDAVPDSVDPDVHVEGEEEGGHGEASDLAPNERWSVLVVAVLAGLVTFAAGLLVMAGRRISEKRAHFLLGGTAGLLLAVALVDLVPEALEEAEGTGWTVALALLALIGIRWITGDHGHGDHAGHEHDATHKEFEPAGHVAELRTARLAIVALVALLFHRIVDGLALPGAFAAGGTIGFTASAAILAHQFPDGLAAASIFVGSGWARRRSLHGVAILSFATPVGALIGLAVATISGLLPHLLAVAAATFLFIALSELLPELRNPEFRWVVATGFLIGYALTFAISVIADLAGVHV